MTNDSIHTDQHPKSYYVASRNKLLNLPALQQEIHTDICVIGGGFSGINTAIELKQLGYEVALLEAHQIGWGASGRNGGQLIRGIGHGLEAFRQQIGNDGIREIEKMGVDAVQIVHQRIQDHQIDCDLTWGYCDLALNDKHLQELEADFQQLHANNYPHKLEMLSNPDAVRQQVNSDRYIGGLLDMGSGHLHPLNLCLGEANVAKELGVKLYEHSKVKDIQQSHHVTVITDKGKVTCQKVVICGNAYVGELNKVLGGKVLPAGSYLIATEPLHEDLWQSLLPTNVAACDLSIALDYFRLSADKRLLFGGMCNYSGRHPGSVSKALLPKMHRVFPQLKDVKIDFEWGGMIGIGANRLPQIGRLDQQIYYAQAYAGHGLNATHMAARLLAQAINGEEAGFEIFNKVKHVTFPGGRHLRSPLLALGMLYHRIKEVL